MNPKYRPEGFDKCLAHLIEECGEVLVCAGKLQRFGRDNCKPGEKETNLQALHREMFDLGLAIERFFNTTGTRN